MSVAICVVCKDIAYSFSIPVGGQIVVGDGKKVDHRVPELGRTLTIRSEVNSVYIKEKNGVRQKEQSAPMDTFVVLDANAKIAVYVTRENSEGGSLAIPEGCTVSLGRKRTSGGKRNGIVINLPFISGRHLTISRQDGVITVFDNESKNGLYLNGKRIVQASLKDGDILSILTVQMQWTEGQLVFRNVGNALSVREDEFDGREKEIRQAASLHPVSDRQFRHTRAPRITAGIRETIITVEKPPRPGGRPQINWLSVLAMPVVMILLMVILVAVLDFSPIMLIMSGVMSAVSAVIAVVNYKSQKKKYGKAEDVIREKYQTYLARIQKQLDDAHRQERQELEKNHPGPRTCMEIVSNRESRLWERRHTDEDFLSVRLGVGNVQAAVTAAFHRPEVVIEEDPLEAEAAALAEKSRSLKSVPVQCGIGEAKQIGVVGEKKSAEQLVRNILLELATAHSYDELKFVVLSTQEESKIWDWVRWLPHCADEQREVRFLFSRGKDSDGILESLEETITRRKSEGPGTKGKEEIDSLPHYLFVVTDRWWAEKHSVRKILLAESDLGCSSVFLCDRLASLPKECRRIIEVTGQQGVIYDRRDSARRVEFQMDPFSLEDADRLARAMAPLFTDTDSNGGGIPRSITFLEGYGVGMAEELDIGRRWSRARSYQSLSVPIAVGEGGDVFQFDIHEKKHGVNGIVAGMPGSGKTEMVQSWLLSLAVNYPPQDVSFVLIDFKGSGMIAPFRGLPHLAGSISNLDINIDRNLTAIRSEVHRREAILDMYSDRNIKNVNDLNKGYEKGLVPERLPVLLIVIDEYAEFKKVFPDFGAEIDSLTSKGRALGIFVILMTQKPAGVVSPKSEDNIKFRWCLRVASYSASREMLGKPDAAKIAVPGRGYVKVGEDDVYEQVQSFWSGAPYQPERRSEVQCGPLISRVGADGKKYCLENQERRRVSEGQEAEIDAVVRHISDYCKEHGIAKAQPIWTDRLPDRISLTDLVQGGFDGELWRSGDDPVGIIGLTDDPAQQRQYPLVLDLSSVGHTVIYGAPVTGKTTLLKTFVMSMAIARNPDEVSIYIMDFGGWNLNVMKKLPHVGGVANDNQPDRIEKLALLLTDILERRKESFSRAGVGSIQAYREVTGEKVPDVILVLDNFGPVLKMYPALENFFIRLTSSGANYGVYLVATATASNAVPYRITQNIKYALALQMVEKSDYTQLVGRVKGGLPEIMGRGYTKGAVPLEFQTAMPAPGKDEKTVAENVRRIAEHMDRCWMGNRPDEIPVMPEHIPYGSIRTDGICLGLSSSKVLPVLYGADKQHYLMISGMAGSGKSSLLKTIVGQMKEKMGGKVYAFAEHGERSFCLREIADAFLTDAEQIDRFVESLRPELQRRQRQHREESRVDFEPILLAVDDYSEWFRRVSNDTVARLLAVVKLGEGLGLYLVAASDAYGLSALYNKGEAVSVAMSKGSQMVLLGGCMNDHGAAQVTVPYNQRAANLGQNEGYFLEYGELVKFRAMDCKGG